VNYIFHLLSFKNPPAYKLTIVGWVNPSSKFKNIMFISYSHMVSKLPI